MHRCPSCKTYYRHPANAPCTETPPPPPPPLPPPPTCSLEAAHKMQTEKKVHPFPFWLICIHYVHMRMHICVYMLHIYSHTHVHRTIAFLFVLTLFHTCVHTCIPNQTLTPHIPTRHMVTTVEGFDVAAPQRSCHRWGWHAESFWRWMTVIDLVFHEVEWMSGGVCIEVIFSFFLSLSTLFFLCSFSLYFVLVSFLSFFWPD